MTKFFPFLISFCLAGCVAATAEDNVSIDNDFVLPSPTLPANMTGMIPSGVNLPPVSFSKEINISDQLSKLENDKYSLTYIAEILSDTLACKEGFTDVDQLHLELQSKDGKQSLDVVANHILSADEKKNGVLHLTLAPHANDIVNLLKQGPANLTLTVVSDSDIMNTNLVPTHFHNNLQLHLSISADKSL